MELLNKSISSFSFDDVVTFCKKGYPEGIQLDYKRELPLKGLAKHFAAFSNTRGGVIIVGVEEDKKTGKPIAWNGIKNEVKLIDRIHQIASNVEAIPFYEVHITDEKNRNIFLLIRIFEGDRTPYYVQNDPNLWVRTGNISKPIDIASPDYTEILYGKKSEAEFTRNIYIDRTNQIYNAALERAERERQRLITKEKDEFERKKQQDIKETSNTTLKYSSRYIQNKLGTNVSMLTLVAQPFYPQKALITLLDLLNMIDQIKVQTRFGDEFPSLKMEPIQNGLLRFNWSEYDGEIECEQLYSNGLVFLSVDVLRPDERGQLHVYLYNVASFFIVFIKVLGNFYRHLNYQGRIIGCILLKDVANIWINRIRLSGWDVWGNKRSLLSTYKWDLELDTSTLNNDLELQEYFFEKIKEIYWSFGYEPEQEQLYKDYLKDIGLLVELKEVIKK